MTEKIELLMKQIYKELVFPLQNCTLTWWRSLGSLRNVLLGLLGQIGFRGGVRLTVIHRPQWNDSIVQRKGQPCLEEGY